MALNQKGISLKEYPLTQDALKEEINGLSTDSRYILFLGRQFPWNSDRFNPAPWTYPEQLFPRLSRMIEKSGVEIIPGILFPDDPAEYHNSGQFRNLLDNVHNHPEPVWQILEETILDMNALCSWSDSCAVHFSAAVFKPEFIKRRSDQLYDAASINLYTFGPEFFPDPPAVIHSAAQILKRETEVDRAAAECWGLVRMLREEAFCRVEAPEYLQRELDARLGDLQRSVLCYQSEAERLLDPSWCRQKYRKVVSALKEEAALLAVRFLAREESDKLIDKHSS